MLVLVRIIPIWSPELFYEMQVITYNFKKLTKNLCTMVVTYNLNMSLIHFIAFSIFVYLLLMQLNRIKFIFIYISLKKIIALYIGIMFLFAPLQYILVNVKHNRKNPVCVLQMANTIFDGLRLILLKKKRL